VVYRILTNGYEERVRGVLGIAAAYLPDTVIIQDQFTALAEAEIKKRVPGYAEKTGDERIKLEAAVIYDIARRLCPGMSARLPKIQQGPAMKTELSEIDWDKMEAYLLDARDTLINELNSESESPFFGMDLTDATYFEQLL
jgi:hypothetical protein